MTTRGGEELEASVATALARASGYLRRVRSPDGSWSLALEADASATALSLIARRYLAREEVGFEADAVRYLRAEQGASGGWALCPGGPVGVDVTVLAYVALRAAGVDAADPDLRRARALVARLGGVGGIGLASRLFLALVGVVPLRLVPRAPPALLGRRGLHVLERLGVAGILVASGALLLRPGHVRPLPPERSPVELTASAAWRFRTPWHPRTEARSPGARGGARRSSPGSPVPAGVGRAWRATRLVTLAARAQVAAWPRGAADRRIRAWIAARQDAGGSFAGMLHPTLVATMALSTGGEEFAGPVAAAVERLDDWVGGDHRGAWQQYVSPTTSDTAFAMLSLVDSGTSVDDPAVTGALRWLRARSSRVPGREQVRGGRGWYFGDVVGPYPECDTTSSVLRALVAGGRGRSTEARDARDWLLSMQNRDGGWPVWCRDQRRLPFWRLEAASEALRDRSEVDVTCRVALALFEMASANTVPDGSVRRAIRRGLDFVVAAQRPDGSWFGRWNVGYAYGTAEALRSLIRCGRADDAAVRRGAAWLMSAQNDDGGWGSAAADGSESATSDAFTTGAVVRTLARWPGAPPGVLAAGLRYLIRTQRDDGSWPDVPWNGVAVPGVAYLRYELMPTCTAVAALARCRAR